MSRPRRTVDRWPADHDAPRVLVENPDGAIRAVCERNLSQEGFQVATCGGPSTLHHGTCPLAHGGDCELAAGADVIYTGLDWHQAASRDVLRSLVARCADKAIIVEATPAAAYLVAPYADSCRTVTPPRGRAAMLDAVRSAM